MGHAFVYPPRTHFKQTNFEGRTQYAYFIYRGGTKMYQDLRYIFWWNNMKREIAQRHMLQCVQPCQSRTTKYSGMLQTLSVLEWKHGNDFFVGLPKSSKRNDSIWVIVNRSTKVAHFIPVKTTQHSDQLCALDCQAPWHSQDHLVRSRNPSYRQSF
jgi:hypothetical protein